MLYTNDGATPRQTLEPSPHLTSDAVWVDLFNPTDSERAAAERLTGLRVPGWEEQHGPPDTGTVELLRGADGWRTA